jgi:uncharacterized membrane protein
VVTGGRSPRSGAQRSSEWQQKALGSIFDSGALSVITALVTETSSRRERASMSNETTLVFGVPVPSVDPVFLAVVRFHILVGIVCVITGVVAMLSQKRRGQHSTFGTMYYWCLLVLVTSATALSLVRWSDNYHLFTLGALSLIAATIARRALRDGAIGSGCISRAWGSPTF